MFRIGILHPVCRCLLPLVVLVVPRHAGLDLLQVGVLSIHHDYTEYASIPVVLAVVHLDRLAGQQIGQMLLGLRAECLVALRDIDALQTYLVLDLVGIEDDDGVPVRKPLLIFSIINLTPDCRYCSVSILSPCYKDRNLIT